MYYNLLITIIIFFLIISSLLNINAYSSGKTYFDYNGAVLSHIHVEGSGYGSAKAENMHKHLKNVGYNSVQINTFCYMKRISLPAVYYGFDSSMDKKYIVKEIENLHKKGFTVMLKPHLWVGNMEFDPTNWRNNIDYTNPGEIATWFYNYGNFIVKQAKLAEKTDVEIFVIGTELVKLTRHTEEWRKLIKKVRNVYNGKLTYAAEGNNVFNIEFWDDLDFIGIDVYFPLTDKPDPDLADLITGWEKYEQKMKGLSEKLKKKIIITEIGYKSAKGTAVKPWEWKSDAMVSQQEQAQAFEAMFRIFAGKEYIEGIYIWKYFTDNNSYEKGNIEKGFTPYGKIAEGVISNWLR